MKKLLVFTIVFCSLNSAYSQADSVLLKYYEQKIIENSKLNNELQSVKQNFSVLINAYNKDTLALQNQIKNLQNELTSEKQKVFDLNKTKIKEERDNLKTKVDSLNTAISEQNQIIADKDKQIISEKANAKTTADNAKNDGKNEVLANIANLYKNKSFDDLIKSSTKESILRDLQLVGDNPEVNPILNDLQSYFSVSELLSKKYDANQIKNAQTQLNQLKRQSKLLDMLREDVEYYEDFNTALKETIGKLIDLDKRESANNEVETQKMKFNKIINILSDYMYNYYDYVKYSYLSNIVLEIINRKQPDADEEITDLLLKL